MPCHPVLLFTVSGIYRVEWFCMLHKIRYACHILCKLMVWQGQQERKSGEPFAIHIIFSHLAGDKTGRERAEGVLMQPGRLKPLPVFLHFH